MSGFDERQLELAQRRVDQEREAGALAAGTLISAEGATDCVDCSESIDAARREAMPSARRCIGCQTAFEAH